MPINYFETFEISVLRHMTLTKKRKTLPNTPRFRVRMFTRVSLLANMLQHTPRAQSRCRRRLMRNCTFLQRMKTSKVRRPFSMSANSERIIVGGYKGTFYVDPSAPRLFKPSKKQLSDFQASFRSRKGKIAIDVGTTGRGAKASTLVSSRKGAVHVNIVG